MVIGSRSEAFRRMCRAPAQVLTRIIARAVTPDPASLAGWELSGYHLDPPLCGRWLLKHRMGLYRIKDGASGTGLGGYIIPCHPGGPDRPWVDRLAGPGSRRTFWFVLEPAGEGRFPMALVVDHSRRGRARALAPQRLVRQYLAQVHEDDPDLFICAVEVRAGRQVRHLGMTVLVRERPSLVGSR